MYQGEGIIGHPEVYQRTLSSNSILAFPYTKEKIVSLHSVLLVHCCPNPNLSEAKPMRAAELRAGHPSVGRVRGLNT